MSKKTPKGKKTSRPGNKRWLSLEKLESVRWLWADNWYDWVISGACEYEGKRYYGVCVDENHDKRKKWYRRYLLVDLPEDVWREELEKHAFFVEKVGSHFEFDVERQVRKGHSELKDSRTWHEFYERYSDKGEQRNYKEYPPVGWFENI
jgi:hypothetical protein